MNASSQQASTQNKPEFGKFQSIFWPVHKFELKKFIPMSILMFCILFVQAMLRSLKDVLIIKCAVCGETELISQLKLCFVMPAAFLIVMLYSFLINEFGFKKTFYTITLGLTAFYAIFLFFLLPNSNVIHANEEQIASMRATLPGAFYYIIPCITNWSYTLFYVFAELWSTVMLQSLFWQFANYITMENEVKRFYLLYPVLGYVGTLASGASLKVMSRASNDQFLTNVQTLVGICVALGILACIMFWYINNIVLKDPRLFDKSKVKPRKKKEKMGLTDGIRLLIKSKYLLLIALISIAYGICVNFSEVIWKEQMSLCFTNSGSYASMQANLDMTLAILNIIISIVGTNLLRKFKWKTVALITPIALITLSSIFFSLVVYGKFISPTLLGINVAYFSVWFGLIQDALSKCCKYTFFDVTKNMAYIPLDYETKTKGQAAVEVVGSRIGKASSSAVQVLLVNFISVGSKLMSHLFTIIPILGFTFIGWILSVTKLNKKYEEKLEDFHAKQNAGSSIA